MWNKFLIHLSSIQVVGLPSDEGVFEHTKTNPMSDYHLTKLEAENVVNQAKMNSTNLRLSSPCGPFIGTTGFIGFVIKHLDLGRDIPLFGKGTRRQDYFDIRVLASVCLQIYDKNTKNTFNLSRNKTYSNLEIIDFVGRITKRKVNIIWKNKPDEEEGINWIVSNQKLLQTFKKTPSPSILDSIEAQINERH